LDQESIRLEVESSNEISYDKPIDLQKPYTGSWRTNYRRKQKKSDIPSWTLSWNVQDQAER